MKIAVVLLNMGGPDSLKNVKPFLLNLFKDQAIIGLPQPFRSIIANLIVFFRLHKTQAIYKCLGGKSPILEETRLQANALRDVLKKHYDCEVFINMRYWHPLAHETVMEVKQYNPDKVILLPLYPQYSTTTTASSFKNWFEFAKKHNLKKPTYRVESYPVDKGFISAYSELIEHAFNKVKDINNSVLLFSAHGIPVNRIKKGDPYQRQVEQTVEAIVANLKDRNIEIEHKICYQSKVGPLEWLTPATDEIIKIYATQAKEIVLAPISFVSEHSETLVELDIDYKKLAFDEGALGYYRVPTVRNHPKFIKGLANLCLQVIKGS